MVTNADEPRIRAKDFERLVARLATHFISITPGDVDGGIETALAWLGQCSTAEGAGVVLLDREQRRVLKSYEWRARPGRRGAACRAGARLYCLPWFRSRLARGERIEIHGLADLPPDAGNERDALARRDVGSALIVPIRSAGETVGFLAFAAGGRRRWSSADAELVEMAAEMFGRLLERRWENEPDLRRAAELESEKAGLEDFALHAAHDLREPLRRIEGYCRLLQRGHRRRLDAEAAELLDGAAGAAARLDELVESMLAYALLGTKRMALTRTDCDALVDVTLDDLSELVREREAEIAVTSLPTVVADTGQLRRVFQNLIANAIKYGGSPPRVHVSAETLSGEHVFSIRDNGAGIPSSDRSRIFEAFERLPATSRTDGSGMGLAICRRIVELHGGRIWVESRVGAGSTFHFSMPRATAS